MTGWRQLRGLDRDGVAFLVRISLTQEFQSNTLKEHSVKIESLSISENNLADSVDVLAAVLKERTGRAVLPKPVGTPRSNDQEPRTEISLQTRRQPLPALLMIGGSVVHLIVGHHGITANESTWRNL